MKTDNDKWLGIFLSVFFGITAFGMFVVPPIVKVWLAAKMVEQLADKSPACQQKAKDLLENLYTD